MSRKMLVHLLDRSQVWVRYFPRVVTSRRVFPLHYIMPGLDTAPPNTHLPHSSRWSAVWRNVENSAEMYQKSSGQMSRWKEWTRTCNNQQEEAGQSHWRRSDCLETHSGQIQFDPDQTCCLYLWSTSHKKEGVACLAPSLAPDVHLQLKWECVCSKSYY